MTNIVKNWIEKMSSWIQHKIWNLLIHQPNSKFHFKQLVGALHFLSFYITVGGASFFSMFVVDTHLNIALNHVKTNKYTSNR